MLFIYYMFILIAQRMVMTKIWGASWKFKNQLRFLFRPIELSIFIKIFELFSFQHGKPSPFRCSLSWSLYWIKTAMCSFGDFIGQLWESTMKQRYRHSLRRVLSSLKKKFSGSWRIEKIEISIQSPFLLLFKIKRSPPVSSSWDFRQSPPLSLYRSSCGIRQSSPPSQFSRAETLFFLSTALGMYAVSCCTRKSYFFPRKIHFVKMYIMYLHEAVLYACRL